MKLARSLIEHLIYGLSSDPDADALDEEPRRFTQDSPVLPDVWIRYGEDPDEPQELLLTPYFGANAGDVSRSIRQELGDKVKDGSHEIAYNQTYVAAKLDFDELVRIVLPLTSWWKENVQETFQKLLHRKNWKTVLEQALAAYGKEGSRGESHHLSTDLLWMIRIVGSLAWARGSAAASAPGDVNRVPPAREIIDAIEELFGGFPVVTKPLVWQVNINRRARTAVQRSTLAIKADAARLLFKVRCNHMAWAIIDSGIDARHPAFWDWDGRSLPRPLANRLKELRDEEIDNDAIEGDLADVWPAATRVRATYDFTRARELFNPDKLRNKRNWPAFVKDCVEHAATADDRKEREDMVRALSARLDQGRGIDWGLAEPFLCIPHDEHYHEPDSEHGTHVGGILGANWPQEEMEGVCPDIQLYDLRVLRRGAQNDEFAVLAALQFVNYLNDQKDLFRVHGVNLSLAIRHDVANFACGRTPVCDECERAVGSGVVVVAAAGNEGYLQYVVSGLSGNRTTEGYHTVSITDPGNAEKVITVGSTHRFQPHTYGVSYFSSRGPTGDGRSKPDLVAPGEKVSAPVPHCNYRVKDGTSMAAPHVSGAAAMLMARHSELIGQAERVKELLCRTATDLGRERYFQGAGMLDVLRALQSV